MPPRTRTLNMDRPGSEEPAIIPAEAERVASEPVAPTSNPVPPRARPRSADRQERDRQRRENSEKSQQRRYDSRRRQADRQVRRDAAFGGSPAASPEHRTRQEMAALRLRSDAAAKQFTERLKDSGITAAEVSKPKQRQQMSDLHKAYGAMMALQAVNPLSRGLNAQNVATTASMGLTMAALSPNFRSMVSDYAADAVPHLRAWRDDGFPVKFGPLGKKGHSEKGERAQRKMERMEYSQGTSDPELLTGRSQRRAKKLQKRSDHYEYLKRGRGEDFDQTAAGRHRELFDEESAALTEIGLTESAYLEMRRPGADVDAVLASYEQSRGVLYEQMERDGVDIGEQNRQMRTIVGRRMESDPKLAHVFGELGHGRFQATSTTVTGPDGGTKDIWLGGFHDSHNGQRVSGGTFSVRPPMSQGEHMAAAANTVHGEMAEASSIGELDEVINSYMVAAAVQDHPELLHRIEDPAQRERMRRAATMVDSMREDLGLEHMQGRDPSEGPMSSAEREQEVSMTYSGAVQGAVAWAVRKNPEVMTEWMQSHGGEENYREYMVSKMAQYRRLGTEAADESPRREEATAQAQPEQDDPVFYHGNEAGSAPVQQLESLSYYDAETEAREALGDQEWSQVAVNTRAASTHLHTQLEDAWAQGPEQFDQTMGHLRLASANTAGDSALDTYFQQWGQQGFTEETQAAMHTDAMMDALDTMAVEDPEFERYMEATRGPQWDGVEVAHRIEHPDAFVPPSFAESSSPQERGRLLRQSMAESISGDLARTELAGEPGLEAGRLSVAMREYTGFDPVVSNKGEGVQDLEWHTRQARIAEMTRAMDLAGIDESEQAQLFGAAYTDAVESVSQRSPQTAGVAVEHTFGRSNWKQEAFAAASRSTEQDRDSAQYSRRRQYQGLSGSDTAHARAEDRLAQGMDSTSESMYSQELEPRWIAEKRRRDNMYHNGHETVSGRWQEASTERAQAPDEPQLG